MKRSLRLLILSVSALVVLAVQPARAGGRAVSLSALESRLRTGRQADVARLCGITSVGGFIADTASRDIILFGEVDESRPALYLDDLIVALRNTRLAYTHVKGRTRYYTAPGCSIDPDPNVVRELNIVAESISRTTDETTRRDLFDRWQEVGRRPQSVRVLGIPFYSHFAKVMVDADHFMKRLTDGSADLSIAELSSLMDMRMDAAIESAGSDAQPMVQSMNRFWFCPGDCTYSEEDATIRIETCRVKLLTEEEYVTSSGAVKGRGRPDPLARRFADSFTAKYDEIASAKPIYRDLEELFRLVGVAKLLDDKELGSVGLKLPYLLSKHKIGTAPVIQALPGLTNLKEISERREIQGQQMAVYMWMLSCGGVNMDVRPKRISSSPPAASKTTVAGKTTSAKSRKITAVKPRSSLKKAVLSARKSPDALTWDYPAPK